MTVKQGTGRTTLITDPPGEIRIFTLNNMLYFSQVTTLPLFRFSFLLALHCIALTSIHAEKDKAHFSLYYVAEVKETAEGGKTGTVETVDGKWETYRISHSDNRKANMEGTVVVKNAEGKNVVVSISKIGVWHDLKEGWEGKGNRMNPLVSYRTVAADTKFHHYGSRLFIPGLVGFKTPGGKELDGYFWVGDVGGGIKGKLRFDIFVGRASDYKTLLSEYNGKWSEEIEVANLPKAPAKFNPRTDVGVSRMLEGLGYNVTGQKAGKDSSERKAEAYGLAESLTDFQKQHPHIPPVEYGSRIGAVTLWYLTQAALALQEGTEYPVTPGGGSKEK